MLNIYRISRERCGMPREEASQRIPISISSLRRLESGESIPDPQTVNRMADVYGDPFLPLRHCLQNYNITVPFDEEDLEASNLAQITLELIEVFEPMANDQRRLVSILKDGIIDDNERPDFERITMNLRNICRASTKLMFGAAQKETPMAATMRAMG